MHKRYLVLLPLCLALTVPLSVRADEEGDAMDQDHLPPGYVTSNDAILGQKPTADMLELAAEYALKNGNVDKAILYEQKALQEDPDDIDIHKGYATALTTKLRRQPADKKDPALFMAAVREWLVLGRAEKGDEKGLSNSKGIGLPGITKRYQDEDRSIPAWQQIDALVGFRPKVHETDKMYLARVKKAVETTVSGQVISQKKTDSDEAPSKDGKASSHSQKVAGAKKSDEASAGPGTF